uniref:H15 domain-containing protein n=1 Tax=Oryzias sinensis TaxID=183150 RepID=A0A8C7XLC2_9TELE
MAEEAPAAAAAPAKAPAKSPKKKKAAARPKKDGLSISKLIVAAVAESKERKGMSLAALKKVLGGKGVDVTKANKRINTAVTKLVTKGSLSQTKGTGASGSFKLAKEPKTELRFCHIFTKLDFQSIKTTMSLQLNQRRQSPKAAQRSTLSDVTSTHIPLFSQFKIQPIGFRKRVPPLRILTNQGPR